ncbi:hypothetical protein QE390_004021 [Siphonobacter sp. SORGH_AS 1065]|nr:hypothetical protein [Siphonobacter sp. SORGH_AS_1065]
MNLFTPPFLIQKLLTIKYLNYNLHLYIYYQKIICTILKFYSIQDEQLMKTLFMQI